MENDPSAIDDTLNDQIGSILEKYRAIPTNTNQKKELLSQLKIECEKAGFQMFNRDYRTFARQMIIGDSFLYRIPDDKKGYLEPFRGKLVRFICVGRIKETRTVMIKSS